MIDDEYQAFMKLNLTPYSGKWIAICEKKVVAHGKKFNAVFDEAKRKCPGKHPFFSLVHGKETWLF